jgi:hypothetical protein
MKHLHFPVAILTHNGTLIIAAAKTDAAVTARLPAGFIAAADTLCQKLSGDVATQKKAKGALGNLTQAQIKNLNLIHQCLAQAQKTGKLAFAGQTVKLHQSYQIGPHDKNDLASFLDRADIVLGAVKDADDLAALKLQGWTDAETTTFQTARDGFGPAETYREKSKSGAIDQTTLKNSEADTLYGNILTIQNAADLEHPASDPANAGVRAEFRLGIFPPDHGGNHAPTPAPAPTQTTPPAK